MALTILTNLHHVLRLYPVGDNVFICTSSLYFLFLCMLSGFNNYACRDRHLIVLSYPMRRKAPSFRAGI